MMSRSRGLSFLSATSSSTRRCCSSSRSATIVSWFGPSSGSMSSHSASLSAPTPPISALSELSAPESRRFISMTSPSGTSSSVAILVTASGGRSPWSSAAIWIEFLRRLHHPDIAFGDEIGQRQAVAGEATGDLDDQPQMAAHELAQRVAVLAVAPSSGKLLLALRAQHGEALGLLDEPHQAAIDSVVHVFAFVLSNAPPRPVSVAALRHRLPTEPTHKALRTGIRRRRPPDP